jgi:hypothetical protein
LIAPLCRQNALEEHVGNREIPHESEEADNRVLIWIDAVAADLDEVSLRVRPQENVIRVAICYPAPYM